MNLLHGFGMTKTVQFTVTVSAHNASNSTTLVCALLVFRYLSALQHYQFATIILAFFWVFWGFPLEFEVNVLLLFLILFILVKKLRDDPHLEKIQYRKLSKAVRGAFMLVPVFGVQQLATIYRFNNPYYQVIDQGLNGMQGLLVSLIVCYTNRTVIESLSKMWNSRQEKRAIGAECRQRMSIQENGKLILKSPAATTEHVAL
uniref:G_PROTEIN_RECEP_F2_4 domain-containing protein n=1 Tax=Caenorhabditis tropicalis TaxID=1561998 RepID=A0A1I7URC8_9PELO